MQHYSTLTISAPKYVFSSQKKKDSTDATFKAGNSQKSFSFQQQRSCPLWCCRQDRTNL